MKSYIKDDSIVFDGVDNLNIALTLDCGQAFRWAQKPNGAWHGVAEKRAVDIIQDGDKITVIGDTDENFWQTYFDLDRDYGAICEKLETDSQLKRAISEYGGIQWSDQEGSWGYGNAPKTEEEFIARYEGLTNVLLDNPYMLGFCYTQLYDVEQEHNGLMTYERKFKFDPEIFRKINSRQAAIEKADNN